MGLKSECSEQSIASLLFHFWTNHFRIFRFSIFKNFDFRYIFSAIYEESSSRKYFSGYQSNVSHTSFF